MADGIVDEAAEFYYEEDLYLEYPDDKYSCPICLCPVQVEAHLTECCGRHFCLPCIGRIRDDRKPCPLCKESSLAIFPNKERQREIRQIRVRCPLSLPCYRDLYDSDVEDANSLSGDESYRSQTDDEECNSEFDEEISVENDGSESSSGHDSDTDASLDHDPQDLDDDDNDSLNELDTVSFDQPLQEEEEREEEKDEATSSGVLSNDNEDYAESSHEFCVESDRESVVSDDSMIEDSFPTDEVPSDASYAFDEDGSVCSDTPTCDWVGELGQIENHVSEVHGEGMLKLLTNDVDYSTDLRSTSEEEILPDEDCQLYSEHTPVQQTAAIQQGLQLCSIADIPPTAANPQLQAIASPESTERMRRIDEIMKRTRSRAESDSSSSIVGIPQNQQSSSLPLNHGAGESIQHSTLQQSTLDTVVHKSVQHCKLNHVTDVKIQHVNTLQQPRPDTVIVQKTVCVRDRDQGASSHTHPIQQTTPVTVVVHERVRHPRRPRRRVKNRPPQDSSPSQATHPKYVQQGASHPFPQCVLQAFNPHNVHKSNTQDGSASWYRERQQGPARPKQSKRHHPRSGKQGQTCSQKSAQTSLQAKAPSARRSSKSRRTGESAGSTTVLKQLRRSSRDKDASTTPSHRAKTKKSSQKQLQVGGSEKVTIQVSNSILNMVQGGSFQLPLDSIQGLSKSAASHTQSGSSKGHSSKESKPTSSQGSRARPQKSAQSRSQGLSKSSKSQKPPDSHPRTCGSQKGSPNEQSRKKQSGTTQAKSAHNKSSKMQSHSQSDTSKSRGQVAQKGASKEQNSTSKSSRQQQVQRSTSKSGSGSQQNNAKNPVISQLGSTASVNLTVKIEAAVVSQNTVPSSQRRTSSKGQSRDATQGSHQAAHSSNPSKKAKGHAQSVASPREHPKGAKQSHSSSQGAANAARPSHKQKQSQGATKGSSHQRGHSQKKPCAK